MPENTDKVKEVVKEVKKENPTDVPSREQIAKEPVTNEVKPSEKKIDQVGGIEKKGLWGILHIYSSPNNAIYHVTDLSNSETIIIKYGKQMVTADKDKPTPYAAMKAMGKIVEALKEKGIAGVDVEVRGPGGHTGPWFPGKAAQAAIKQLVRLNFPIGKISDHTPIAHGGCTPRKTKRKK